METDVSYSPIFSHVANNATVIQYNYVNFVESKLDFVMNLSY